MHTKTLINVDRNRIRDENGTLIATVWPREVFEFRNVGESWIEMRQRTDPLRAAAASEAAANARLFAAAPDLLDALQAILPDAVGNHIGGPDTQERINNARAAIAKATGAA